MIGEGIVVQMTNINYKPVLKLLHMIPAKAISNYNNVISKEMKRALDPGTYGELITRSQGEVNKQGHIVLMNIGVGFYET